MDETTRGGWDRSGDATVQPNPQAGLPATPADVPLAPRPPGVVFVQWIFIAVAATGWSIVALVGIILLAGGLAPGDATGRFMVTMAALGLFGLQGLAGATLAGRRTLETLGWVGVAAAGLSFILVVALAASPTPDPTLAKVFGAVSTVSSAIALGALLLLLSRRDSTVDALVFLTLSVLAVLSLIGISLILGEITVGEGLGRTIGVLWILTALGFVVTPLLSRYRTLRKRSTGS